MVRPHVVLGLQSHLLDSLEFLDLGLARSNVAVERRNVITRLGLNSVVACLARDWRKRLFAASGAGRRGWNSRLERGWRKRLVHAHGIGWRGRDLRRLERRTDKRLRLVSLNSAVACLARDWRKRLFAASGAGRRGWNSRLERGWRKRLVHAHGIGWRGRDLRRLERRTDKGLPLVSLKRACRGHRRVLYWGAANHSETRGRQGRVVGHVI
mmetsp:Transcript_44453/g.122993  ORF Transcript_44453/g.122993 Transcript_44453/m.122993 type:complete len:211 (-) Transcript_44453:146-778(-)